MFLTRAPALATDADPAPFVYDPTVGVEAFAAQEDAIRRMDSLQVGLPYLDASTAAVVAIQFARNGRRSHRREEFDYLQRYLHEHTPDELEQRAQALWYLDTRTRSVDALKSDAKVNLKLVNEGVEARARVLALLSYYFDGNEAMQIELADIRGGTGVMDLARDLVRLAGHVSVHKARLEHDTMKYREDDEAKLRGIANQIIDELNKDRSNPTSDLRNRAWTRMVQTYTALKSAADFLFRDSPADLAAFPPLRSAVLANTPRRAGEKEVPAPAPVVPSPTNASEVSPAASAPTGIQPPPGLPGGNPLT